MILGVHLLNFDIGEIEEGDFLFVLNYDTKKMILSLILFQSMVRLKWSTSQISCLKWFEYVQNKLYLWLEVVIFNIIRRPDEKNNDNYNDRWPFCSIQ
jgi:hypothetical protein